MKKKFKKFVVHHARGFYNKMVNPKNEQKAKIEPNQTEHISKKINELYMEEINDIERFVNG